MKKLLSVIFGAFAFFVLGDSSSLQGQNQPTPQPVPDYICESMKGYEQGMCLAVPTLTLGGGDAQGPLAGRIPIILIHGWQQNRDGVPAEPDIEVWRELFRYFYESQWFGDKFKAYFLFYWSNVQSIRDMGLTFMSLIDRMDGLDRDFRSKQLVLIGHSMGGLVARSYMQEVRSGSRVLPGERVLRLITLGTPHHGTPIANGPARDDKAGIAAKVLFQLLDHGLFNGSLTWSTHNRFDLHWDNYDCLFDCQTYPEKNIWLERLNSGETFKRKISVYGGIVSPLDRTRDCNFLGDDGDKLKCSATLMSRHLDIPQSDGVVPLKSALFEPCDDCLATRIYQGYDHSEIARGKERFPGEPEPLFEDIASNLLSLAMPRSAGFDNYADLGNPDDEQFHNLSGWDRVNPGLLPRPDTDRTSRYQTLRGRNSIDLSISNPGLPHRLTFRSEAGYCDDIFNVLVNDRYIFTSPPAGKPDFPIHAVMVPAGFVSSSRVKITFQNLARDNCGLAAIYYVRLDPLGWS